MFFGRLKIRLTLRTSPTSSIALVAGGAFSPEFTEGLRQVLIAKEAWLDAAKENGKAIPRPRYRPAIYQAANS
ncbi:MAG: hypothetical protein Q7R50_08320 [Dehalococcoidales bacterium]|nr:hypothetical protein [Dehalococcoidales bacterium]